MSQEVESPLTIQEDGDQLKAPSEGGLDSTPRLKRKKIDSRSVAWNHFDRFVNENGEHKAKCKYCCKQYNSNPKVNGTTSLLNHRKGCTKLPHSLETREALRNMQPSPKAQEGDGDRISCWKFDQEVIRRGLAYMIIVDELPFKHVEGEGFKHLISLACPRFQIPSRWTVLSDCYQLYIDEKKKLKQYFKNSQQRVCLTTDTWVSIQNFDYMCLTAHFIDEDWKLNKRILNFCQVSSHNGKEIGKAIEKCLLDWGIEKVFTLTVDNASSNDIAAGYMKEKLIGWGTSFCNGEYFHMRCAAHIINLVVQNGLKEIGDSVHRVRESVRYVRQSPARYKIFKECAKIEKSKSKRILNLDVSTRWNSTYMMLDASQHFERAFKRFEEEDSNFKYELLKKKVDMPNVVDWDNVRRLVPLLENFFKLTLRVSGSLYVTSNTLFHEISSFYYLLIEWQKSNDLELCIMAKKIKVKFDKYWGDVEKVNKLVYIPIVLDPRRKFMYLEFALEEMYGTEFGKSARMCQLVRDAIYALFDEYKNLMDPNPRTNETSQSSSSSGLDVSQSAKTLKILKATRFKRFKEKMGSGETKSELDRYLQEGLVEDETQFDILEWWKIHSHRLPVLSCMARDVLAIPISTVASESAFSTGGQVLDCFRSSLTPKIVQALICAQDWLRASSMPINIKEDLIDIEKLENDLSQIAVEETVGKL